MRREVESKEALPIRSQAVVRSLEQMERIDVERKLEISRSEKVKVFGGREGK